MPSTLEKIPSGTRTIRGRQIYRSNGRRCEATGRPHVLWFSGPEQNVLISPRVCDTARFATRWFEINPPQSPGQVGLTAEQLRDIEGIRRQLGDEQAKRVAAALGYGQDFEGGLFHPGQIGVAQHFRRAFSYEKAFELVRRHMAGDFGQVGRYDPSHAENEDVMFAPYSASEAARNALAIAGSDIVSLVSSLHTIDQNDRVATVRITSDLASQRTLVGLDYEFEAI